MELRKRFPTCAIRGEPPTSSLGPDADTPHQTAPRAKQPRECVTVTMPVHPRHGMTLGIVRIERHQQGRRYVTAEHPGGGNIRLPFE